MGISSQRDACCNVRIKFEEAVNAIYVLQIEYEQNEDV